MRRHQTLQKKNKKLIVWRVTSGVNCLLCIVHHAADLMLFFLSQTRNFSFILTTEKLNDLVWWPLHVPSIFAYEVYGFRKKKKKKNLVSCSSIQSTFSKAWSWEEKPISVSSCASNNVSNRRYQPGLCERCQRRQVSWTRFSTMVRSPSCYPNTNKQRRNIGVNDRGGGWRRVGGRAKRSRAPEP